MLIIKIKNEITDSSLGQIRPGAGKLWLIATFHAARESFKQII